MNSGRLVVNSVPETEYTATLEETIQQQADIVKDSTENELLALQVQAFLNAPEVDADDEIIDDILEALVAYESVDNENIPSQRIPEKLCLDLEG